MNCFTITASKCHRLTFLSYHIFNLTLYCILRANRHFGTSNVVHTQNFLSRSVWNFRSSCYQSNANTTVFKISFICTFSMLSSLLRWAKEKFDLTIHTHGVWLRSILKDLLTNVFFFNQSTFLYNCIYSAAPVSLSSR